MKLWKQLVNLTRALQPQQNLDPGFTIATKKIAAERLENPLDPAGHSYIIFILYNVTYIYYHFVEQKKIQVDQK